MPDLANYNPPVDPATKLEEDIVLDLLYLARTGALAELKEDVEAHSQARNISLSKLLSLAQDPFTKNSVAHYAAANGHISVLSYIQTTESDERLAVDGTSSDSDSSPDTLFKALNEQGSTPLHYAAVNGQLEACEELLKHPKWKEEVDKRSYVELRNRAGRTARDEADAQGAGREEWLKVVGYLEKFEDDGGGAGTIGKEEDALDGNDGEDNEVKLKDHVDSAREEVGKLDLNTG